jgi:hypothetical protein
MKIKDLIDKLSSYNLFNYLFPGLVFVVILDKSTSLVHFSIELNIISITIIYFIGLIISRVWSLIIEEILLKTSVIGEIDTKLLFKVFESTTKLEIIHEQLVYDKNIMVSAIEASITAEGDLGNENVEKMKISASANWSKNINQEIHKKLMIKIDDFFPHYG